MSVKLGQTLAGLLNASFGNAVEIIVGIAALLQGMWAVRSPLAPISDLGVFGMSTGEIVIVQNSVWRSALGRGWYR